MAILNVTRDNFEEEVINADVPVLVDFWAAWCGPCKMLAPIIDEVEKEAGQVKICKINVDEEPELASRYGVMSIPTLIVMKDGETVNKSVGYQSKDEVLALIRV